MVTGAGSGIGQAISWALLERGTTVYAGALNEAEFEQIAAYPTGPGAIRPVLLDVTDETGVNAAAATVADHLGTRPLDALLNIAGIISNGPLTDLEPATLRSVLAVNVVGVHAASRAFLPLLRRRPGGRIINMSSSSGKRTLPFTGAYSASKYALEALSTAMRLEFAPLGVHVGIIAPGLIKTPMAAKIEHDLTRAPSEAVYRKSLARFLQSMQESTENGVPLGRVVETVLDALARGRPRARYEIHNNFFRDVVLLRALPEAIRDRLLARALHLPRKPSGDHP